MRPIFKSARAMIWASVTEWAYRHRLRLLLIASLYLLNHLGDLLRAVACSITETTELLHVSFRTQQIRRPSLKPDEHSKAAKLKKRPPEVAGCRDGNGVQEIPERPLLSLASFLKAD
jgi:hypothetical protein